MASRNFHKRRTKERKDRQRAERIAERKSRPRPRMDMTYPPLLAGVGMAHEAGLAAMALANDMLHRRSGPIVVLTNPREK